MSARVLVVDDVEVNVRLLEAKLSSEYFTVLTAMNGEQALQLAQSEHPDIILLDVISMIRSCLGFTNRIFLRILPSYKA